MGEGAHLDGGLDYDVLQVGFFGADGHPAPAGFGPAGRYIAVPYDVPVGTPWTTAQGTVDGAGEGRSIQWAQDVISYWDGIGQAKGFKLTPNTQTGLDTWSWTSTIRRRRDFKGRQTVKFMDSFNGSSAPVQERGPYDVIVSWHDDPSPKVAGEFAYTELDTKTNTYHVRIARGLDDPARPPPYNTERFYKETVWHEMGHVLTGLLMEMYGEGKVIADLEAIFGAGWNGGAWENRTIEAAAETFKDWCYPERQYDNRTNKKLPPNRWEKFGDLMMQQACVPGKPLSRVMGDVATDLVSSYSGPVDRFPFPQPDWDYGQTKKVKYDFPRRRLGFWGAVGSIWGQGDAWQWGGNGTAPSLNTGPIPWPDYRKPPPPGSKVRFHCRWDDPLGELPTVSYFDIAAVSLGTPPPLPRGVVCIDTGGPATVDRFGNPILGVPYNRSRGGIVWLCGRPGAQTWDNVLVPDELAKVTWQYAENPHPSPEPEDFHDRYEPVYLDCRAAGEFTLELVVPDHGGELALGISWTGVGISVQNNTSNLINEVMPVRTYPTGQLWTVYPFPVPAPPYEEPRGGLEVGQPAVGFVPVQHIVVGKLSDAIPLINPRAGTVEIEVK